MAGAQILSRQDDARRSGGRVLHPSLDPGLSAAGDLGDGFAVAAAPAGAGRSWPAAAVAVALPAGRVRPASLGAAQPPALQERDDRQGLEADPLRPSPEPARPLGAVRRALHHPAGDPPADPAAGLVDRRRGRRGDGPGHRRADLRRLRVLPLRPASAVHAAEWLAARDQEAPSGPPLPQRAGQFRHHAGRLGPGPGHGLREPARGAAQRHHPQSRLRRRRAEPLSLGRRTLGQRRRVCRPAHQAGHVPPAPTAGPKRPGSKCWWSKRFGPRRKTKGGEAQGACACLGSPSCGAGSSSTSSPVSA